MKRVFSFPVKFDTGAEVFSSLKGSQPKVAAENQHGVVANVALGFNTSGIIRTRVRSFKPLRELTRAKFSLQLIPVLHWEGGEG